MDVNKQLKSYGEECQAKFSGRFKKSSLGVIGLGENNAGRIVDYFVHDKKEHSKGFLIEVKALATGGYDDSVPAHRSTRDPRYRDFLKANEHKLHDYGPIDENLKRNVKAKIEDAINQCQATINSYSKYAKVPFLVAFCFDADAGFENQINFGKVTQNISDFSLVSGILTLEKDYKRQQINKKHLEKINNLLRVKGGNTSDNDWRLLSESSKNDYEGTRDTIQYKIRINRKAKNRFQPNRYFQSSECVVEKIN